MSIKQDDIGFVYQENQSGGGTVEAFVPLLPGITYVPMKNEIGFTDGVGFYPLQHGRPRADTLMFAHREVRRNVFPAGGLVTDLDYPDIVHEPDPTQYLLSRYARFHSGYWNEPYASPAKVELRRPVILDTPLHRDTPEEEKSDPNYVPNYGVEFGCMTQMLFSKPMNTNDTSDSQFVFEGDTEEPKYIHDAPFWRVNAAWTKTDDFEGTLTLTPTNNAVTIYYTLDGTDPDDNSTEYTGPIPVTAATQVKFIPYNDPDIWGNPKGPCIYDLTISTFVDSFAMQFPTMGFDGTDTAYTLGSNDFNGLAFRYATYNPDDEPIDNSLYVRPALDGSNPAIGTRWYGEGFLPAPLEETHYLVGCWRYGMVCNYGVDYDNPDPEWEEDQLDSRAESNTKLKVQVKIGKITYSWDGVDSLTLTCSDPAATIRYSTDGSAPSTTYTGPITIADTTTIKADATRDPEKVDSDVFEHTITFDDTNPPAEFEQSYWSSIPEEPSQLFNRTSRTRMVALNPFRRPDYYVSPGGSGDGLTAATPASWQSILGHYDTDTPTATSGDIVWCSQGTYLLPRVDDEDQGASFRLPNGVRALGGFDAEFTKRDINGQRTVLASDQWYNADWGENLTQTSLTGGGDADSWYDGFQLFLNEGAMYYGTAWTSGCPGQFVNCINEDVREMTGGRPGDDRWNIDAYYYFGADVWVGGKIDIDISSTHGFKGTTDTGSTFYDLFGLSSYMWVEYPTEIRHCHDFSIVGLSGNGGASAEPSFHQSSVSAGSSSCRVGPKSSPSLIIHSSGTITGVGGDGGSVPSGGATEEDRSMEGGGNTDCNVSAGTVAFSRVTVNSTGGAGGNSGQACQFSARSGGDTYCGAGVDNYIMSDVIIRAETGGGGEGGRRFYSPENQAEGGYCDCYIGVGSRDARGASLMSKINAINSPGNPGGGDPAGEADGGINVRNGQVSFCKFDLEATGSAGSVFFAYNTDGDTSFREFGLFDLSELNISELTTGSHPFAGDWFARGDGNGAGIPLEGYETPVGTGTAANRWLCPPPP